MTDIDPDVMVIAAAVNLCDVATANLHLQAIQQQARAAGMEEAAKICLHYANTDMLHSNSDGLILAAAIRTAIEEPKQ